MIDGGHCQPRHRTKERDGEPVSVGGDGWPCGPGPLCATAGQMVQGDEAMHAMLQGVAEVRLRNAKQQVRAGACLEVGADSQPEITITRMLFLRG